MTTNKLLESLNNSLSNEGKEFDLKKIKMDVASVCQIVTIKYPFYGFLFMSMIKRYTTATKTLSVGMQGINPLMKINPIYWMKLSQANKEEVILHELNHLALFHYTIRHDDKLLDNYAKDIVVNQLIHKANLPGCPITIEFCKSEFGIDLLPNQSTDYYYQELLRLSNQQQQKKQQGSSGQSQNQDGQQSQDNNDKSGDNNSQDSKENKSQNQNGEPDDNISGKDAEKKLEDDIKHSSNKLKKLSNLQKQIDSNLLKNIDNIGKYKMGDETPKDTETGEDLSKAQIEMCNQQVQHLLEQASEQAEKSNPGSTPAYIKEKLAQLKKHIKPRYNWKSFVRRFAGNCEREQLVDTMYRPNYFVPNSPGVREDKFPTVLIGLDISASMSSRLLTLLQSDFLHLTKNGFDVTIVTFDTEIHDIIKYDKKKRLEVNGRGGTDFNDICQFFKEHQQEYSCLIVFSDGECSAPKFKKINAPWERVLWAFTQKNNDKYLGKKIHINVKDL